MENASKALIIAGAILLAILLISLGIMVFQQGQDAIKNSGMSKAEISAFNGQFTKYEGDRRGSDVKSLIQEVNTSNASDVAEGNERQIQLTSTGANSVTLGESNISGDNTYKYSTSGISSTSTYTVTVTEYDESGFIKTMTIVKKTTP